MTYRINARGDRGRRELERAGDVEAQASALNERRRTGEISEGALSALVDLGYEPASLLVGREGGTAPIYRWSSLRYPDREIFDVERRIHDYGKKVIAHFAFESIATLIGLANQRGMLVHDSNRDTELFKSGMRAVPFGEIGVDEIVVEYGLAPLAYIDLCAEVLEDPSTMLPNAAEIREIETQLRDMQAQEEEGRQVDDEINELEGRLYYAQNPGQYARDMRDAAHVASEHARDEAEGAAFHFSDQSLSLPLLWYALAEACASLIDIFFGFRMLEGESFSFTQSGTTYLPNEDLSPRSLLEVMANCAYGYGYTNDPTNFHRPFGVAIGGFDSMSKHFWPRFVSDFSPDMIETILEEGL